jgi:hypothetical protein
VWQLLVWGQGQGALEEIPVLAPAATAGARPERLHTYWLQLPSMGVCLLSLLWSAGSTHGPQAGNQATHPGDLASSACAN